MGSVRARLHGRWLPPSPTSLLQSNSNYEIFVVFGKQSTESFGRHLIGYERINVHNLANLDCA